jgi:transposase
MPSKYDASTRAKAVRLVREHAGDYPTEWAAITAVSGRLGMSAETLRKWIRQAEVDEGKAPGVTSSESAEIRELRRKNRELEQTIDILKAAASFSRGSATRDSANLPVHRPEEQEFGIAPICRVLSEHGIQIAPRTYWARLNAAPGKRELWDIAVTEILAGIYEPDEQGRTSTTPATMPAVVRTSVNPNSPIHTDSR